MLLHYQFDLTVVCIRDAGTGPTDLDFLNENVSCSSDGKPNLECTNPEFVFMKLAVCFNLLKTDFRLRIKV